MADNILIIDDEQSVLDILEAHLESEGYACTTSDSPLKALELLKEGDYSLLLTDLRMPELSGMEVVRRARELNPDVAIILVTALLEVTSAIEAMRIGAYDYVLKPFNLGEISISVSRALEKRSLIIDNRNYQQELELRMKDTQRDLDRTNVYLENLLNSAMDAIITTDKDGNIQFSNLGAQRMLGYSDEEMSATKLRDIFVGGVEEYEYVRRVIQPDNPLQNYESEFRHKMGQNIPVSVSVSFVAASDDQEAATIAICKDITEQKRLEHELKEMTIRDSLTGLYNQRHFYERLEAEIERAKRQAYPLTLLLVDVDRFKTYNDSHGHLEGDNVLQEVGNVINECTRQHVDFGFRYGGDEFTVILPEAPEAQARQIAERIRTTFEAKHFDLLTLSIGLMTYTNNYSERAFIQFTDSMMYDAKRSGGNKVCVYDSSKYAQTESPASPSSP